MALNVGLSKERPPLQGVVLCCTALPHDVRTCLADVATQMGAVHRLDLTADVTHLVVGSTATPKYKYVAKERPDIKVLSADWLEAVRISWMEGGDVDVESLERRHHFLPFANLQLCITGFDSSEQRNSIAKLAEEHGATCHGDLTKLNTHLIAAAPRGAKYAHAKKWAIPVVSLKWFEDSLRRGMALDEACYDPTLPLEEQGRGAFKRQRTSLGKHGREGSTQTAGTVESDSRKRLRRTASTRLESQSQDMWFDMSAQPAPSESVAKDQWRDDENHSRTHVAQADSTTNFERRSSMADSKSEVSSRPSEEGSALFFGLRVLVHGFEQRKVNLLTHVLQSNGATIVESASDLEQASLQSRFLLVPHTASATSTDLPDLPASTTIATEWWVERCIHNKTLLDPRDDPLSCPIGPADIDGFSDLVVSTTGFSGVDLRQIADAVKSLGASYQEKVIPSASVMISGSTTIKREKAFYASKHRIPVVSADWLWACLKARRKVSFGAFKIVLPTFDPKEFMVEAATGTPAASNTLEKAAADANKRKDDGQSKRLSSSRKSQATPSLELHTTKATAPKPSSKQRPIIHEDEDEDDASQVGHAQAAVPSASTASQKVPKPLQQMTPNSSPRKAIHATAKGDDGAGTKRDEMSRPSSRNSSPSKPSSAPTVAPPARTYHELTSDLADLLSKANPSRPSSAGPGEAPPRRKSRPLGRALSGTSNRSLSATASSEQLSRSLGANGDEAESGRSGMKADVEVAPPPSTQLGYETLEAENHRLQMGKKMGTELQDDADRRRVPSLGVVKDTTLNADAGVGNRVRGRARMK